MAQPAFVDPSFETPNLGACPNFGFSPAGSGWAYGGSAGITTGGCQQQTAASTFDAPTPPAGGGTQAGFIQSGCCVAALPNKVTPGSLSQTVTGFQAGHSYNITFYAAGRPFNGGCNYGCTELDFSVLVGTTDVLDVKNPPPQAPFSSTPPTRSRPTEAPPSASREPHPITATRRPSSTSSQYTILGRCIFPRSLTAADGKPPSALPTRARLRRRQRCSFTRLPMPLATPYPGLCRWWKRCQRRTCNWRRAPRSSCKRRAPPPT